MKAGAQGNTGILAGNFKGALRFFAEVLGMELLHCDEEAEFLQIRLPSGETLELPGLKNRGRASAAPPAWELLIVEMAAGPGGALEACDERSLGCYSRDPSPGKGGSRPSGRRRANCQFALQMSN